MASTQRDGDTFGTRETSASTAGPAPPSGTIAVTRTIVIFALVTLFSVVSMLLERHSDGVAVIWLSNGLLFGVLIRERRALWPLYALLGWATDTAGSMAVGEHALIASISSMGNSMEVFLAASLLVHWFGFPLRLSRPKPLFAFFIVGVLFAPAVASIPSVTWLRLHDGYPFWTTFRTLFLGDALGMAIIAPLTYVVLEPGFFTMFRRRVLASTLLVLTAPVLAAMLDFGLVNEPVLFLLVPSVVLVAFRLGFPGTVVAIFLIFCIAIPFTVSGHGPLALSPGVNMLHKIAVVQIVVAIALFTAFPVASLLEERTALEHSLIEHQCQLIELANTDALTGHANRRAFDDRLEAECQRASGLRRPLSLLLIDIDLFKSYNDLYGHIAGDDCLRQVSSLAATALHQSTSARLYRVGGEEFAVILPEVAPAEAKALAERIRATVEAAHIEHKGSPFGHQTVSIGMVTAIPALGQTALSLIALSDQALYRAKRNGRNRFEAA